MRKKGKLKEKFKSVVRGIKLQFIPFNQLMNLSSYKRIKFLLDQIADNKIIILQGKLSPEEEADLIEETMNRIRERGGFKGIEIETLNPKLSNAGPIVKFRKMLADALVGDRDALTLIGPATLIKEIKKDIRKLELFLKFK